MNTTEKHFGYLPRSKLDIKFVVVRSPNVVVRSPNVVVRNPNVVVKEGYPQPDMSGEKSGQYCFLNVSRNGLKGA